MDNIDYKKRPFRFPFDINPKIFIGLSIFFFIFSIKPVLDFFTQKNSKEIVKIIEHDITKKTKKIQTFISDKEIIKRIITKTTTNDDITKLTEYPFYFFILKNKKIHFWNNSILNPITDSITKAPFCTKTLNGIYYVQNWSINQEIIIQTFIPIKQEYGFFRHNKNLYNKLIANEKITTEIYDFSISTIKDAEILKIKNKPILYVKNKNTETEKYFNHSFWNLFFYMFFFIAFGVSIHTYFKVIIQYKSKVKIFIAQLILIFSIRAITYLFNFPINFSEFHIFNPDLFHLDFINISLGDFFINVCLFFWILEFYAINVQSSRKLFKSNLLSNLFFIPLVILLISINYYSVRLFNRVIESNINLEGTIQDIFSFPKFIAISSLLMLVICNVFLILICNRYFEKIYENGKIKFLLIALFSIGLYFVFKPENILIYILSNCWIMFVVYSFHIQEKTIKFDFSSIRLLLWIVFLSLTTSSLINYFVYKKNYTFIQNISIEVNNNRDTTLENKIKTIHENILTDSQIINLFLSDEEISRNELYDLIINKYIGKDFNHKDYLLNLYGYNPKSIVLYNKINFDLIDSNFQNHKAIAIDKHGKFLVSSNTPLLYISKIEIKKDNKIIGHIFFRIFKNHRALNSKLELLFPLSSKFNNVLNQTTFAIYENYQQTYNSGSSEFPIKINTNYLKKFNQDAKNISIKNKNKIFLIKTNMNILTMSVSLFTVIFIMFLAVIIIYIVGNIIARSNLNYYRILKLLNVNLRFRINFTFLIVVLMSFAAIWFFIINYYISISKENERAEILKSSTIIFKSIINGFKDLNQINKLNDIRNINKINNFKTSINRISTINNCEISFFDLNGLLVFNTDSLLYTTGLRNNLASPNYLFNDLSNLNLNTLVNEKIGKINYLAAYTPIYNQNNKLIGFLKCYYLKTNNNILKQTSNVLIYLSNIFLIVFALSIIITYLITSFLTTSFTKVVKQFTKINLNTSNEPLQWKYNDEIGILVMEYNRMLKKLEFNSLLLAKNNRELAWREMAKQVAHEIKNPLTPMKLSLQMLERAMKNNSPNFKDLAKNMLDNLIEQINNLETIAINFGQFAKMPEMNATENSLIEILKISTGIYNSNEDLEFHFILPFHDYIIFADKEKIIRVITNLFQNAVQSIPNNKKGKISLITSKIKNNMIRISVEDNGSGIPDEIAQKVFEPNFTTKSSGTGLGLAMCKDIIEQINGNIHFSTIIDKGTIFNIDLPIKESLTETEIDEI